MTDASEEEVKAYTQMHLKLRRYYEGRAYISALNRAQEGLYYHRDQIEEQETLLSEYYEIPPDKLRIEDLELIHRVYSEMIHYRDNFGLNHPNIQASDILILTPPKLNIWQRLGLQNKHSVLFLNFLPSSEARNQEESLHEMFAELIGPAYLNEFNQLA